MSRTPPLLVRVALACSALACREAPAWPPPPAPLRPGEEACAGCRMLVSDARFAVQLHARAGDVAWFDDLGCLLESRADALAPEAVLVRDCGADAWVRGDAGFAVQVPGLDTPMGSGWIAHGAEADARAAARAPGARLVPLSELLLRGLPDARHGADRAPATTDPGEEPR